MPTDLDPAFARKRAAQAKLQTEINKRWRSLSRNSGISPPWHRTRRPIELLKLLLILWQRVQVRNDGRESWRRV
jgi:hypothetical protein